MKYDGASLTTLARAAIAGQLGIEATTPPITANLRKQAASFVTLHADGALRGCIGSLEAYRPLYDDLQSNAVAAAFRDPRFPPLTAAELPHIRIEVSVLSALEPMPVEDERDAVNQLRPGVDGVVLHFDGCRGTFLPQVWEQLPEPAQFLAHLKLKAGLPADFWDAGVQLQRYRVHKYGEQA